MRRLKRNETVWRPLHHGLHADYPKEAVVHFFLVNCFDEKKTKVPCGDIQSLGELMTGNKGQVTCFECLSKTDELLVDYFFARSE